jgi:hypothetical protein
MDNAKRPKNDQVITLALKVLERCFFGENERKDEYYTMR